MRPGIVVQVRINPSTAQSIIDVLDTAGMSSKDKSFAVCVSAALNILIDTAKNSGVIPEPDPFDYVNKLRHHIGDEAPDRRYFSKKNMPMLNPSVFPTGSQAITASGVDSAAANIVREAIRNQKEQGAVKEWVDPMIPTDPDAYATLVFQQPNYKDRKARDLESQGV